MNRHANDAKQSRRFAIGLYVMAAVWGAMQVSSPDHGDLFLIASLLFAGLASGWLAFDSKAQGIKILPILQMVYFFLWPIGAGVYLVYRSGVRGLLTFLVHAFGICMTIVISFYVTLYGLHLTGLLDEAFYQ